MLVLLYFITLSTPQARVRRSALGSLCALSFFRRVIIFNVVIRADAITAFNHTCERAKTSSLRLASGQRVW